MKVVSVSMIKNESDIVESFVRNTLKYVDSMIVLDQYSTDGTDKILQSLQLEGLPIYVHQATTSLYIQSRLTTELIYEAKEKLHADIIVPLDTDEFIVPNKESENLNEILHRFSRDKVYRVKEIITIPVRYDKNKFLLYQVAHQALLAQNMNKVIVGAGVLEKYHVGIEMGNHNIDTSRRIREKVQYEDVTNFYYAHYQVRSIKQFVSKIANGWITALARPKKSETDAIHWRRAFQLIKTKDIDERAIYEFLGIEYDKKEERPICNVIDFSMLVKKENIKYSQYITLNPFRSVLNTAEHISEECSKMNPDGKSPLYFMRYFIISLKETIKEFYYRKIRGIPIHRY